MKVEVVVKHYKMYLYSIGVMVEHQHSRTRDFLGFHHSFEVSQQTHVFGHICSQNLENKCVFSVSEEKVRSKERTVDTHHVNDEFPQALFLPLAEVLEDVTVLLVKQLEAHSQVMVLQHRLIVIHQS